MYDSFLIDRLVKAKNNSTSIICLSIVTCTLIICGTLLWIIKF